MKRLEREAMKTEELTVQEAALAWAQGKRVQCLTVNQTEYLPVSRVGTSDGIISPTCFGERDEDRVRYKFRLAPEPPAKKWRPWTEDEVPVGVKFRENGCTGWFTATCAGNGEIETLIEGVDEQVSLKELFDNHVHSLDNGKTWLPCGVEVSE